MMPDCVTIDGDRVEFCPFKQGGDFCKVRKRGCRFALTDTKVPKWCPLPLTVARVVGDRHGHKGR